MAHLITGYAGSEHIQSADDGAFNASFAGDGQFVMAQGNRFNASIISNNTVRILDGNGMMYGRHFRINSNLYEEVQIATGTAGKSRIDLIVMEYQKDNSAGTETVSLKVIKGTESSGTPSVPSYTNGNILEGATKNQMPLYKVKIEGIYLTDIEKMFTVVPTFRELAEHYEDEFINACESHLESLNVLDSMEEIQANTQSNQLAGALAVKAFYGIRSHIGMIIQSTTLDTEEKVKAIYGGTSWTKIEGRMLIGASSSYPINTTGGSATNTLSVANLPSHAHTVGAHNHPLIPHTHGAGTLVAAQNGAHTHGVLTGSGRYIAAWASNTSHGEDWAVFSSGTSVSGAAETVSIQSGGAHTHSVTGSTESAGGGTTAVSGSFNSGSTGSGTAVNNMPPYKTVYIWERTA